MSHPPVSRPSPQDPIVGVKVHLGCGRNYLDGYINCDTSSGVRADRYFDLNVTPYPLESGTAQEIWMDNVLEHLDDIPRVMEELHRILGAGGRLKIRVPYAKTDAALQDPTHKHYFTEKSMNYFAKDDPYNFYSTACFRIVENRLYCTSYTPMQRIRNLLPLKRVLRHFLWNIYDGVYFELEKA